VSRYSQTRAILGWLEKGNSITPIDALRKFGSFRLGARIWDLRRAGHPIEKTLIHVRGKRFAEYRLVSKLRRAAA